MGSYYQHKIFYLSESMDFIHNFKQFVSYPDTCPICRYGITPEYLLVYLKNFQYAEVLCGCPRENCESLFVVEYIERECTAINQTSDYVINRYYPYSKEIVSFPAEIENLSPRFIKIYQQAHHAEKEGLDLICGAGYRKSLEFLVKDYAISMHPNDEGEIKDTMLRGCIKRYVVHPKVSSLAEKAAWLGNDESHYERKWHEKDVQDLKMIIKLIVSYIEMELVSLQIELEMSKGR